MYSRDDAYSRFVLLYIQDKFLGEPVDEIPTMSGTFVKKLKAAAFEYEWDKFYDFIEFLASLSKLNENNHAIQDAAERAKVFINHCNAVLVSELSAYRFVDAQLIELTDDLQLDAVESAATSIGKFSSAQKHLQTAIALYGNRENPDFRNSIKESISAIESVFFAINGKKSGGLHAAIKESESNGIVLHGALRAGILNIYGWTSDEGGVRHAMLDNDKVVGEAEAKLMLVLCSALMNYIIGVSK